MIIHPAVLPQLANTLLTLSGRYVERLADSASPRRIWQRLSDERHLRQEQALHHIREAVQQAVEPLLDEARIEHELANLSPPRHTSELPAYLAELAARGGFNTVVVSDDVGLPLATSRDGDEADELAGVAALLHAVVERAARCGSPSPLGVSLQNESGQCSLHRFFTVEGAHFALSAVSPARRLGPCSLDPNMREIRRVLTRSVQAAPAVRAGASGGLR